MIQTKIQKTLTLFNSNLLVDEYNPKNWDECFELKSTMWLPNVNDFSIFPSSLLNFSIFVTSYKNNNTYIQNENPKCYLQFKQMYSYC